MNCIKNIEKLFSKLEKLEIDTDEIVIKVLNQATEKIKKNAKVLCPVGKTGRLRNSIYSSIEHEEKGKYIGIVSTNVNYAPYVELGTGPMGQANMPEVARELGIKYRQSKWKANIPDVGWRFVGGQVPKPFLYPAFKQSKPKILQTFRDELSNSIREAR